ncbi:mitochondrial carrier [Rozella allomycis CSF55]|uniref:Mitochondrial carrier n=1 Tax=Rozella allomycis (strain CSF55) TaxID=988480 RepID=A0A075ATJ6_ROZAC|nr:Mitochondrial substrate/solute carrier domain-containing protein [Rozella allomycis CSF55]RKP20966.1 mitochondrial carrier [Rozella allomycis CSF55]|eukprot:EPZ33500.1 Mitochondrial substrate/solute carrier domain-containing protein [Rozella allomycis CSF55]
MDVVKVRLQAQVSNNISVQKSTFIFANDFHDTVRPLMATNGYKGTLDGIKKIVKQEGFTSLWRGLSPTLVMSVPATVVYYVGYEHLKGWFSQVTMDSPMAPLYSGALARTASFISPIELIRTRAQASTKNTTIKSIIIDIKQSVSLNGLAIYWLSYENTKAKIKKLYIRKLDTKVTEEMIISFIAGATSGMIAAVLTTPFDVAKTRRQIETKKNARYSVTKALCHIFKEEGYRGLFKGVTARVGKVAPACAIMISSYEVGKRFM